VPACGGLALAGDIPHTVALVVSVLLGICGLTPPKPAKRTQLGGKPTSLLISNEKAALEQCVRALIDREKQDENRKQEALQEWAMLASQEEEAKNDEAEELLEEKEVAEEEEDFSLKQAREAVGAATQRVEGKLRALKVRRRKENYLVRSGSGQGALKGEPLTRETTSKTDETLPSWPMNAS